MSACDPRLLADVTRAEGSRATAYRDLLGNWTAGVGHLLDQKQDWANVVFSPDQIKQWIASDLADSESEARGLLEWSKLNAPCRKNAIIEIIFNMGDVHWRSEFPKTRSAIFRQDWQAAHDHLIASPEWVKEVGIGRVTRLANYLLDGDYPSVDHAAT